MNIKDLLDRPIAFQRAFVSLGAGLTGALMLSQAVYWSKRNDDPDSWFYKTMDDWEAETGMTRAEQEGARKKLVKLGILQEMKKGVPCRLFYRVDFDALRASLSAENMQSSLRKSCKLERGNPANKSAENKQASSRKTRRPACRKPANIHTENTTETTTENLQGGSDKPNQPCDLAVIDRVETPRCEIPADMPGPKDPQCRTFKTWANYAMAYRKRYDTWPVWNASVGGILGKLIDRLGIEVTHSVAAYFVGINDAQLIRECHSLKRLLAGAESYHTQWVTKTQMNATTAQQVERKQANLNAGLEAAQRIRERAGGKPNEFL